MNSLYRYVFVNSQNKTMNLFEDNGAVFSDNRKYRYALWRIWDKEKPLLMFIGLNPSTANESQPDPTIIRVEKFTFDWGYGGFYMMNLFSFVTAYPEELTNPNANNAENDSWLYNIAKTCKTIIYCWGDFKVATERSKQVLQMFPDGFALVINKNGTPRHPLYVKGDTVPIKFKPS